jgi:hypothetical protein
MKIIDVIIKSYCYIAKNSGIRNLDAAISAANVLLTFNSSSLIIYIIGLCIKVTSINIFYNGSVWPLVILVMIIGGVVYIISLRTLERAYLNKRGYSRILNTRVPKVLGIIIVFVHYFLSIGVFFYSLYTLPQLPK